MKEKGRLDRSWVEFWKGRREGIFEGVIREVEKLV